MKSRLILCTFLLTLTACGGGGGGGGSAVTPGGIPTPSGVPASQPQSVDLGMAGATRDIVVSETGYSGMFTATLAGCSAIASISNPKPSNGSVTFTVTALNQPGTCSINISDVSHQNLTVPVSVTFTSGTIQ